MLNGAGGFGQGHDLTLLISKPLSVLGNQALPIFFNFFFVFSIYFLIKPFVKYPEFAFVFGPVVPLASVYAQIFALGFFNFALGSYFRDNKKACLLFFCLIFLAHYWTGLFAFGILMLFFLIHKSKWWALQPAICIVTLFFFLIMPQGISFLGDVSASANEDILHYFFLLSRGFSFFMFGLVGLYMLYFKNKDFFKLNFLLFFIPLAIALVFRSSTYWAWRVFYFIPMLALFSVLMSSLYEMDKWHHLK